MRFTRLPTDVMSALREGDLDRGRALAGLPLTEVFVSDRARWLWGFRLDQLVTTPSDAAWVARAVLDASSDEVVGYAGFHGGPDERGMVEIGYTVDPECRRRGYARGIVTAFLAEAQDAPGVSVVRATISPDNVASLATIDGFGFEHRGEQIDEIDGVELIFEYDLPAA